MYRSRAAVKAEPTGGSWLADALTQWRELNSASHFLQVRGPEGGAGDQG